MRVTPLVASRYLSDGGAAFGVVPYALWSQWVRPDSQNRIPVTANVLLLELRDGRLGLVDTGCGPASRYTEKEQAITGLHPEWYLRTALEGRGVRPEDIEFVILTHLHWDHVGGAACVGSDGAMRLAFPRAMHVVHQREWRTAFSGDRLMGKAYPVSILAPLRRLPVPQLRLLDKEREEVFPGVVVLRTGGHTEGHCMVWLEDAELTLEHPAAASFRNCPAFLFASDICPTHYHLKIAYHTAYDLFPLEARAWKRDWFPRLVREGVLLFFDHDSELFGGVLREDEKNEFAVATALPVAT